MAIINSSIKFCVANHFFSLYLGKVVHNIILEYQPREILVFGSHVGYILLRILRSSPEDVRIFVLETNTEYIAFAKFLLKLVNKEDKVSILLTFEICDRTFLHCLRRSRVVY